MKGGLLFVLGFLTVLPLIDAYCSIPIKYLASIEPLILDPSTRKYVRADRNGNINLKAGQAILLACPGNVLTVTRTSEALALCKGGVQLLVNGRSYKVGQLECQKLPNTHSTISGKCMKGKANVIKMGYKISSGMVELIEACHDTNLHHTYYTKFILMPEANAFRRGVVRSDWMDGGLFRGLDPTNLYRRQTERSTFSTLLHSSTKANQFINMRNDYFLSKGHLTAKADFMYGSAQMVTFYYANAAPQWQTANGGNWNRLEDDVKSFTARYGKDLEVYTGTYGRASLPDVNNNWVDLYLSTSHKMPVPRMFWKILYDRTTTAGIAFITLNNPYHTVQQAKQDVKCPDISSTVPWLKWNRQDIVLGYSYTCEVNSFRSAFQGIPEFPVNKILK